MKNKLHHVSIDDNNLYFVDISSSQTLDCVFQETFIDDTYKLKSILFEPGDIVIDIGAHVGTVSIFLAKKYPFLKIYAYEAHPINYKHLIYNIQQNETPNIIPYNFAVYSEDNFNLNLCLDSTNTGGTSSYLINDSPAFKVPTISLDSIIKNHNIDKIKFLKIDCEGAEFDIIENSSFIRKITVEYLSIEIHSLMKLFGRDIDNLISLIHCICPKPTIIIY